MGVHGIGLSSRSPRLRGGLGLLAVAGTLLALNAAPAAASPVATNDAAYSGFGRVFPDPLAGCVPGVPPCSPNAQGNVPATQFIQIGEFLDAIEYMSTSAAHPEWRRYLEVQVLDGALGANGPDEGPADADLGVGSPGADVFPGNDLPLEYDPKPEYRSAGLPTSTLDRNRSDLIVLRVTDEAVPDAGKKRYALSLSIHGIERAGVEGGTRAMEDLVTAATTGRSGEPVVPPEVDPNAPTFAEVLEKTIIYFTYPNPDGWRRGSVSEGGFFFQRYNGNGVDLNRDWPDIGFTFRPYSGLSEPESRGLAAYLDDVKESTGDEFAAGDDLHGQPFADALSFTLLPHGRHDFGKDLRIRDTAIAIHRASESALLWSPAIQPNDAPPPDCAPDVPEVGWPVGNPCFPIYGQTWGTVYDTINYTVTGAVGDYFDSSIGLGADGIDNEMSFSHIDKNINFDPHTEQLHVDGNKALIYAHLAEMVDPLSYQFDPAGAQGYVPNLRLTREEKEFDAGPPPGTVAQTDINGQVGTFDPADQTIKFPFTVKRGPQPADGSPDAGNNVFNGGMRIDVTTQNIQAVGSGIGALAIQCRGCDEHPGVEPPPPGVPHEDDWITVTEDYNQSPIYAQSGVTAAVNRPQAFKTGHPDEPVEWRAVLFGDIVELIQTPSPSLVSTMNIDFTQGRATDDGATGGDDPPRLAGYDVANTDFFPELNGYIEDPAEKFQAVNPDAVIAGSQSLAGLKSLVLADDALPGFTGNFVDPGPVGPPTADFNFESEEDTDPGLGSRFPGTYEDFPFTIAPDEKNGSLTVRIDWASAEDDFDMYLYFVEENGDLTEVDHSAEGSTNFEELTVDNPGPGDYVIRVDNFLAGDPDHFTGSATFEPPPGGGDGGTGAYTDDEKDAWIDALKAYVNGGGNLVLTDGALKALPALTEDLATPIPPDAIERQTVYLGQVTFDLSNADGDETTDDPLARDVAQEGARFNTGNRRQTFEPTPLGFSIQNQGTGGDESNSRQHEVDIDAWEAAGGRSAGTSVNELERDAAPVYDEVALGELPMGSGQIRIAGGLLPQPSQEFDHTLGLEPFAVTYTGYILICNLVDCTVKAASSGGGGGDGTADGPEGSGQGRPCANEIVGDAKRNKLNGTEGSDRLSGRGGNDRLKGRAGKDCIRGGAGRDRLGGGKGGDDLRGGRGQDRIKGGKGADSIRAALGGRDRINCGPGKDVAVINERKDRARKCEKVKVR